MSEEYTILAEECGELTQACCKRIRYGEGEDCLLYTSPSPRDNSGSRMPSSA